MNGEWIRIVSELEKAGRLESEKGFFQHGNTTVYEHSVRVVQVSLYLTAKLKLRVNEESMIRGAMLHDYFLYDWHDNNKEHCLHGFRHPYTALKNAEADFRLNKIEKNIILRHMFPLTPIPPFYKEAWIVCAADKYCALEEKLFHVRWWDYSRFPFQLHGRICLYGALVFGFVNVVICFIVQPV